MMMIKDLMDFWGYEYLKTPLTSIYIQIMDRAILGNGL